MQIPTRIKHTRQKCWFLFEENIQKQQCRFVHVENMQIEHAGSRRRQHTKRNAGLNT